MTFTDSSIAEESVVGCILVDAQRTLPTIRGILQPGDFAEANARAIFRAAVELDDNRLPIDPVTLQQKATEMGSPVSEEWIREAMHLSVTTANVAADAEVVHKAAVDREARNVGAELTDGTITPEEALKRLQDALTGRRATLPTPAEDAVEFLNELSKASEGEGKTRLSTGFRSLDEVLGGGLVPGMVTTLAGRTSMGKSAVALEIASNVARYGGRVLYISLEMTRNQLRARQLASRTGLSATSLSNGIPRDDERAWKMVGQGLTVISKESLQIWDRPCSVDDIELIVRAALPLDLIVVDHMGKIRADSKMEANAYIAGTFKVHRMSDLAKSTGVPVLMLCQVNRGVEARDDKRPRLADLRDTGAIEEDSDAVLILFREGYYQQRRPQPWDHQTIEIDVAKNRSGQTGVVKLDYVGAITRVRELDDGFRETNERTPFDERSTA